MKVQQFQKPKIKKHKAKNNPRPKETDLCVECLEHGKETGYAANHEVFHGNGYRQQSIKYKMQIRLCPFHHLDPVAGIHFNREFDYRISCIYRDLFIEQHGAELFRQVFGDNMAAKELKHESYIRQTTPDI